MNKCGKCCILAPMPELSLKNLTALINSYAKTNLTESRYAHSVRVAEYSSHLASLYKEENVMPELAYFTGLSHDICKKCDDETLLKIVKEDGLGIDEVEKTRLNLLHGRAAAVILKTEFGVTDNSILKAVAFHTFGYEGIDALGKIVYIADKIEPGRPDTERFREFAETASLNTLMLKVLDWNISYIEKKGGTLHTLTQKMYDGLLKEAALIGQHRRF
ncbi:bis(5'-nucleosyl)-tetraphosphatase (symmetrical) YqeK [Treponema pedis]|uniref:bis(5'-nucleosyl)-tetraphosphatase (symmetrical) n=2 Tax=Treponema pedis TaxID=409322 RepID=S6A0Q2_9SPIR|nr:bis(5'-nucleosyl)-tetraphosphatase (symmetrical) YqeK [Treponema pedis]AGT44298.1 nicotinate-nucleotide adenylyltransferase [Treponema pedis str. T A4]